MARVKSQGVSYEEVQYEAYGPGGAAVIIDMLTDNKNRAVGEIRHVLTKHGGNLAEANAVAWMFTKRGYIVVPKSKANEEDLMAAIIDAGGDDLRDDDDNWEVLSSPEAFPQVLEAVKKLGIEPDAAEISMLPQNYLKLEGKQAQQMVKLMDALDDHDDVRHVWSNFDIEERRSRRRWLEDCGPRPRHVPDLPHHLACVRVCRSSDIDQRDGARTVPVRPSQKSRARAQYSLRRARGPAEQRQSAVAAGSRAAGVHSRSS